MGHPLYSPDFASNVQMNKTITEFFGYVNGNTTVSAFNNIGCSDQSFNVRFTGTHAMFASLFVRNAINQFETTSHAGFATEQMVAFLASDVARMINSLNFSAFAVYSVGVAEVAFFLSDLAVGKSEVIVGFVVCVSKKTSNLSVVESVYVHSNNCKFGFSNNVNTSLGY